MASLSRHPGAEDFQRELGEVHLSEQEFLLAQRLRYLHDSTMGPAQAAHAARLLKVRTVVPMHYGTFPLLQGNPDALRGELKKLRGPAKVVDLEVGKATAL